MRCSIVLSGLCLAASAVAQAVSEGIAPTATAPAGCKPTFTGNFTINVLDLSFGVNKAASQLLASSVTVTLKGGILHDSFGRTGAIVANHQFQFDGPPQAGSIYTGGFSACANESLALGASTIFYACTSGSFRNLYDENVGAQCSPVNIVIVPVAKEAATTSSSASSAAKSSSSASKTSGKGSASESGSTTSPTAPLRPVSGNSTVSSSEAFQTTKVLAITTLSSLATGGTTPAPSAAASASASSTVSTGAAVPTVAVARDILGAAVGAFGAAIMLL